MKGAEDCQILTIKELEKAVLSAKNGTIPVLYVRSGVVDDVDHALSLLEDGVKAC